MKKERKPARHFDDQFRLSVLKEYYESGVSYYQIAHKYGITISNIHDHDGIRTSIRRSL